MDAATPTRIAGRKLPDLRLAVPAVVAAWALVFELPRFVGLVAKDPAANDFRLSYVAAQAGLRWGWSSIYDPGRLHALSLAFGQADAAITPLYTYDNPPLLAFIVAALTLLPLPAAFFAWSAINAGAFAVACRLVFSGEVFKWLAVVLASLALWPTVFALERGQSDLLVFALAVGCWWMVERRRERWAGVLLAVAWALKPHLVLFLPAVLLICGFARAAAWWLLTTAALWAWFAVVVGPVGLGTLLAVVQWSAADPGFVATPFFAPFGPQASLLVSQALFTAITAVAVWRHRRTPRVAFAIGIVGALASGVHLHDYDYVALVVAAWLLLELRLSALEWSWLALGVLCVQLPPIGVRWPIVLWVPIWLLILWRRPLDGGQTIPSSQRASSDMRSGVQTGS